MDGTNLPASGPSDAPKSPRSSPNAVRVIDVLTYPAVKLLDVTGPAQVFATANDRSAAMGGARPYVLKIVAQGGEGATTSAGVALAAGPLTQRSEALDTLLIAGGLSLSALAHQAGMSKRGFSRHYTEAAGQTPARAIERLRMEAAQNQLLESGLPVKRIALRWDLVNHTVLIVALRAARR